MRPFRSLHPFLQLPESDELTWDDGSPTPEPCLDIVAPTLTKVKRLICTPGYEILQKD